MTAPAPVIALMLALVLGGCASLTVTDTRPLPASRLEPREGTAIGTSGNDSSSNNAILALEAAWTSARNCQESNDLPSVSSLA